MGEIGSYAYCPIKFIEPGKCPKCRRVNLCVKALTMDYYILDDNANPRAEFSTTPQYLTFCPNPKCGFTSNSFYPTPKGFKYVPFYDRYCYDNIIPLDIINTNIEERTFEGNPFAIEDGE